MPVGYDVRYPMGFFRWLNDGKIAKDSDSQAAPIGDKDNSGGRIQTVRLPETECKNIRVKKTGVQDRD